MRNPRTAGTFFISGVPTNRGTVPSVPELLAFGLSGAVPDADTLGSCKGGYGDAGTGEARPPEPPDSDRVQVIRTITAMQPWAVTNPLVSAARTRPCKKRKDRASPVP
jgi:hypothetical protein